MQLDAEACYRAMASRDRRFDGRFIIGVKTTGIYCRPGCPARTPRRESVAFFGCAAAAERAGLRACLRCRPDASPGSPAQVGTPTTVRRALRLIGDGALDLAGVDALAARLGVGARHLRRLFDEHLGASPIAIAQTQRVHFARKLIEETGLPMTEIASDAGFSSIRRFNDALRSAFGRTPGELRKSARAGRGDPDRLVLRLPFRPPLDWEALLGFLAPRAIPGVEAVSGGAYMRSVELGSSAGTISVRKSPGPRGDRGDHLGLEIRRRGPADLFSLVARVRRLFDLDADPVAIEAHLGTSELLAPLVKAHPGLRAPGAWDGFELAVRAILGQQITVKGATTLAGRLVRGLGAPVETGIEGLTHLFPGPERLVDADLSSLGLTASRAASIRALARAVLSGLSFEGEEIGGLMRLQGVGAWTAQYIAMRAGREPDAFPAGDLVLRRRASPSGEALTQARLEALSLAWRPFRAYAALHLWTKKDSR